MPTPMHANAIADWFNENSSELISGAINIVIIAAVALILRAVVGKVIDQLAKRMVASRERLSKAKAKATSRIAKSAETPKAERQRQRANTIASVLRSVATFVIFGIAFVTILSQLGINIGPIIASAGVLGLAIGFGAQSLVQDFLSGLFMMAEDQYGVGDTIDAGDAIGTVEAVTLRVTKIRDYKGGLWHVRNGEILRVCNMNQDWANAVVEIPLDYRADLATARDIVQRGIDEFAAKPEQAERLIEKPSLDGVVDISGGAMTVRITTMTQPGAQWAVERELREVVKSGLDAEGIKVASLNLTVSGA